MLFKKFLVMLVVAFMMILGLAGTAGATNGGDKPDADNKKVELCHATGSESNPFVKIEVSVKAFYQAGHIDHEGDIWNAFTYTTVGGDTVTVPAQGDTSLLAFDKCQAPKVNEKVAKPDSVYLDKCGTKDDVFSVVGGKGYTVGSVVHNGDGTQSIAATLLDGFDWLDGTRDAVTITRPEFTNVDCGLPDTGGKETAQTAGYLSLGAMLMLGALLVFRRRSSID